MRGAKKWLAACLAGVLALSLTGCGGRTGTDGTKGTGAGTEGAGETENGETAMGRYVESSRKLDIGPVTDLVRLTDGRLVLLEDGAEGRYVSSDGGETWEVDMLPGWYELVSRAYVMDMKGAPDGSVALLCQDYGQSFDDADPDDLSADGEEMEEEEAGGKEAGSEDNDEEAEGEEIEEEESGEKEKESELILISPEGEVKQFPLPGEDSVSLVALCWSEDGKRLFLATRDEEIYEVDQDTGERRLLLRVDAVPNVFCVWEHYLAVKNEMDGVFVYDLDTGEAVEDDVLTDFVAENYQPEDNVFASTYTIFPAEDGGIYLAGARGLHRHVIGGAVMEQVINGGLCGLSDPSNPVSVMIRTTNDGFLAAFSKGKLSSFTYDPAIPSMPSQTFSAYSLTENDILRQAITRYQEANPDIYVEYRVGLGGSDGATREDAVKKLNTEIMAGTGPDLILLDGLPTEAYREKGVLLDLTPYLAKLEEKEKLLPNIRESFTQEGRIPMIPAAVTLPVYYTDENNMTQVSDLSSLADMFENLREDHPREELMELYSKDMLFDALFPVSAPGWVTETGQADPEKIAGDLEQMKRIYDACMEGLPDQALLKYKGYAEGNVSNSDKATAYNDLGGGAVQMKGGNVLVSMGELKNGHCYGILQSVKRCEGQENNRLAQIPGRAADAFTPIGLMSINAASPKADLAGDFLQMILSKDMQAMIYPVGFPVNEEGLSFYLESLGGQVPESRRKPGESYGAYGYYGDDGKMITLDLYVPTVQEGEALYSLLEALHTPYLQQTALEDAVREAAEAYLDGICSLEEAMDVVREKSAIIMAE